MDKEDMIQKKKKKEEEDMIHINNGILLGHKKEWIGVNETEMDEPRAFTQSEDKSEKKIMHINTYIWNLEKWYQWSYL